MQIQPILGYCWAIFGLYQPPGPPPFWISASPFYISWIRPCLNPISTATEAERATRLGLVTSASIHPSIEIYLSLSRWS